MNLLILGGSGFLSRYIVREAVAQGYTVWCVTRGLRGDIPDVGEIITDRNDLPAFRHALRQAGVMFDAVIDCICFSAEQARADLEILPEFTSRLIVISTDSVYHPEGKQIPQNEDGCFMQDDSYGGKKRQMELTFLEECPAGLCWTLFRPPHMFGAGSELGCFPMHTRQPDLVEHLRQGKPICLVGGGNYLIQPLYAGDMAAAAVAAVSNPAAENQVFCIAGPEVMPNRSYFVLLGQLLGLPVSFQDVSEEKYRAENDTAYLYLCPRAYDLTKLEKSGLPLPRTTLAEGLRQQVDALLKLGR